jgi:hypothetical protein
MFGGILLTRRGYPRHAPLTPLSAAPRSNQSLQTFRFKGLFLLANSGGSKLWRLKYRFAGKEKLVSLGSYPEVSLKNARERRIPAFCMLADLAYRAALYVAVAHCLQGEFVDKTI